MARYNSGLYSIGIEAIGERYRTEMKSRHFNVTLPTEIDWLSNAQLEQLLGISPSYLRRDKSALRSLGILKIPQKSKGLKREGIELLVEFRELVRERGRSSAIQEIWRKHGTRQR